MEKRRHQACPETASHISPAKKRTFYSGKSIQLSPQWFPIKALNMARWRKEGVRDERTLELSLKGSARVCQENNQGRTFWGLGTAGAQQSAKSSENRKSFSTVHTSGVCEAVAGGRLSSTENEIQSLGSTGSQRVSSQTTWSYKPLYHQRSERCLEVSRSTKRSYRNAALKGSHLHQEADNVPGGCKPQC